MFSDRASSAVYRCSPNPSSSTSSPPPSLLVFSGGTAFDGVVEELKKLTTRVAHVLPVSDDEVQLRSFVFLVILRYSIVKGEHPLWKDVLKPYRETIRSFWHIFSIRSLGVLTYHSVSVMEDIPVESLVLPVISTKDRLTLGCELLDGTVIRGQNKISHPTNGSMTPIDKGTTSALALPSRVNRVFYMSSEGCILLHEVFPPVNPTVLEQLKSVDCIIYAMGFTWSWGDSIIRSCSKVLMLNSTHDRETSGFSASCFVIAITDALNRTYGNLFSCLKHPPSKYINTLRVPKDGQIPVDFKKLHAQGIFNVITVDSLHDPKAGIIYEPSSLIQTLTNLSNGGNNKNATST